MKGQNAYKLAQLVHKKMYDVEPKLPLEEKRRLYAKYFELIKKAAYQGHVEALYEMGSQFEDIGYLGIPNPNYDPKKCVYWYAKACQKEHVEACNNLATFFESGVGCEKSIETSLALYKQSGALGSPNGKKNYKILLRDMAKGGIYYK